MQDSSQTMLQNGIRKKKQKINLSGYNSKNKKRNCVSYSGDRQAKYGLGSPFFIPREFIENG